MKLIREILRKAEETEVVSGELVQDFQLEEGDRVVGVLPEELRGLYAVFATASHELDEHHKQLIMESKKFIRTLLSSILDKPEQELDEPKLDDMKEEIDSKHEENEFTRSRRPQSLRHHQRNVLGRCPPGFSRAH